MTKPKSAARQPATRLLTVQQTAEHLQLSDKTIKRKIASGELPAHRFGSRWRIAEEDLRLFKLQRRVGGL